MRLKKYEIRISVTKNLYDRIYQEAKNRDTKMAVVAREKLIMHFSPQLITPFVTSNPHQDNPESGINYTKLIQTETRLSLAASRIESLLALNYEQMKFIITMIDRLYIDLMTYLPEIPKQLSLTADATAKLRHQQWLEKIKDIVDCEK